MATIGERIIRALGGATRAEIEKIRNGAFQEGIEAGGNDEPALITSGGTAVSTGYRQVGATPRDLSAISQERAIEAAYRLWNTNPLAKALTEITVDFVLGDQVKVVSDSKEVQEALDAFLGDPVNDLVVKMDDGDAIGAGLESMAREIGLFGEYLALLFVRDGADKEIAGDGRVRLGSVDPSQIHSLITDAKNRRDVLAVRLKSATGGADGPAYKLVKATTAKGMLEGARDLRAYKALVGGNGRIKEDAVNLQEAIQATWRTVRGREWTVSGDEAGMMRLLEAEDDTEIKTDGECMLFQVNKISTGLRGRPDLLQMIDWLDRFDQLFFDGAEHVALLNMFSWDLKIEGGSENAPEPERNLRTQANKVAKMHPGSVYAHNEHAALEAKNPDLKTAELEMLIRQLRVFISGGARIPEHWISEGGYTNRATAAEMGTPTYRMLIKRQGMVRMMLTRLCQYQIDVKVALGLLPDDVPVLNSRGEQTGETKPARESFRVEMADINVQDTGLASRSFASVAQAILPLAAGKFISKRLALEFLSALAQLMGVAFNVEDELAALDGEGLDDGGLEDELSKLLGKGEGEEELEVAN